MKCEFCGNNLGIEDAVCPYCGRENSFASKHISDMKEFREDYASTKDEVLRNSRLFNSFTARLTTIAILTAMILAVAVGLSHSYDIRSFRETRRVDSRIDEHRAKLEYLCGNRDYLGVYYYYSINRLAFSDHMHDYDMIIDATRSYHTSINYLDSLFRGDSPEYVPDYIEDIAGAYDNICSLREPATEYDRTHCYNDFTTPYVTDMCDHLGVLIQACFNLSSSDMEGFAELSKSRKTLILEEAWENAEEQKQDP